MRPSDWRAVPPSPSPPTPREASPGPVVAAADGLRRASASDDAMDVDAGPAGDGQPRHLPLPAAPGGAASPSRSLGRSVTNSQESTLTASTDEAATPPASDTSAGLDDAADDSHAARRSSQLLQLSAVAAAQDRIATDGGARKRMADGEVKARGGSQSPPKGHARTTSAVSVASTAASSIGELSAELKTRLSYAMVKVNHGWQSRSLDEVESLASQAASLSPASSGLTVHGRHGSSASPRPLSATQVRFAHDVVASRPKSISPPSPAANKPSVSLPGPGSNRRRNSNAGHVAPMLSHAHAASPRSPGPAQRAAGAGHPISCSEQDAAESLLFMSSPGNSASLKPRTVLPSASPRAQPTSARGMRARHALSNAPRKAFPSGRPPLASKKAGLDRWPGMPPPAPDSPMDLDAPQQASRSPNRAVPRRRAKGAASQHVRAALSLPSGLGLGKVVARRTLRDEDIERMLDRAGAEAADSSGDEEIQLPAGRRGVAGAMEA